MKAIVCTKYGAPDVLQLKEVEKPGLTDDEVMIRVYATSVTAAEYRIRGLNVPVGFGILMRIVMGFSKPRKNVLGMNFAGMIQSVGKNVTRFKVGDPVFGSSEANFGAYAEYMSMPEIGLLAIKPANITYEEAAVFPFGALTALSFLRDKGKIKAGEKLLIYGASGAVGTASVQLAKYFGADVTAVCSSDNVEMVRSIGANKVIDYTKEDFTKNGEVYDIIFDTVGKTSIIECKRSLSQNGRYLITVAGIPKHIELLIHSMLGSRRFVGGVASATRKDFLFLTELFVEGKIKSVIDRCYPYDQTAEAHAYAEKGHKKGNVPIIWHRKGVS